MEFQGLIVRNVEARAEEEPDVYTFVISTPEIDRHGTIIEPAGIDYAAFMNNPVVLAQHKSDELPVGKCLGLQLANGNLEAKVKFHRITEEAAKYADLVKDGYLNMASVGIMPIEWEMRKVNGEDVCVYPKSELFEFSIATVGSNRGALVKRSFSPAEIKRMIFNNIKKRMLTPDQEQQLKTQLLPGLVEAMTSYFTESMQLETELATKAAQAAGENAITTAIAIFNGKSVSIEVESETETEQPATTETPAEQPVQAAAPQANRAGAKISSERIARLVEAETRIQEGCKILREVMSEAGTDRSAEPEQRKVKVTIPASVEDLLEQLN